MKRKSMKYEDIAAAIRVSPSFRFLEVDFTCPPNAGVQTGKLTPDGAQGLVEWSCRLRADGRFFWTTTSSSSSRIVVRWVRAIVSGIVATKWIRRRKLTEVQVGVEATGLAKS